MNKLRNHSQGCHEPCKIALGLLNALVFLAETPFYLHVPFYTQIHSPTMQFRLCFHLCRWWS